MMNYEDILDNALKLTNKERWNLIDALIKSKFEKPERDFAFIDNKSSDAYREEALKSSSVSEIFFDVNGIINGGKE